MERSQFTFYRSFFESISRIRKKADRADAYDAIANYALNGIDPNLDNLSESVQIVFLSIKPTLDVSARKAKNGKNGGSKTEANAKQNGSKTEANAKQNGSKTEANAKQNGSKTETRGSSKLDIELERELDIDLDLGLELNVNNPLLPSGSCGINAGARAELPQPHPQPQSVSVEYFLRHINANASGECLRELLDFERQLGGDVTVCALRAAQDEQITKWTYIRSILNAYVVEGVRTVDDVRRREQKRTAPKHSVSTAQNSRSAARNAQFATADAPLSDLEREAIRRSLEDGKA